MSPKEAVEVAITSIQNLSDSDGVRVLTGAVCVTAQRVEDGRIQVSVKGGHSDLSTPELEEAITYLEKRAEVSSSDEFHAVGYCE